VSAPITASVDHAAPDPEICGDQPAGPRDGPQLGTDMDKVKIHVEGNNIMTLVAEFIEAKEELKLLGQDVQELREEVKALRKELAKQ
jgi:hypothetical protein